MSLVLNVEILGEFKNLTAATKGAQSSLNGLQKTTASISRKMTAALAAVGLGFSLRTIINELEEAGKAAVADTKSQEILALAMRNTGAATDSTVKSAEASIKTMQLSAAVADDKLRPAYQKLFIATKDVTETNKLMKIALDASAATGKDLDIVSQAMAKALTGTDTALIKLIPSLKGSKTPIEDMAKAFEGAAEKAANTDPYARMQVIFGELQEQIGVALIPLLEDFSTWLATPEGQEKLGEIVDLVTDVIDEFGKLFKYVLDNKDWLVPLAEGIGIAATVVTAIGNITKAINIAKEAQLLFNAAALLNPYIAGAAIVGTILSIPGSSAIGADKGTPAPSVTVPPGTGVLKPGTTNIPKSTGSSFSKITGNTVVQQNITIKGQQSAQDIASVLLRSQKSNGVPPLLAKK